MAKWDRLGQVALIAGALDVVMMGIVPTLFASKMQVDNASENAQRLAAALAEVAHITRPLGFAFPLMGALLAVVGVGLLREARWARVAGLLWSVAALLVLAAQLGVNVGLVWPRIDAAEAAARAQGATEQALQGFSAVKSATVRVLLLRLPFPLILLFALKREPDQVLPAGGAGGR